MDHDDMLQSHKDNNASLTVAVLESSEEATTVS